jgi:hypothetical protein
VGASALAANVSGTGITVFGSGAYALGTAGQNEAFGTNAMGSGIVTGGNNSAFGRSSLLNLTSGTANVAYGQSTMELTTTGSYNVAIGRLALLLNTTGSTNVAVGYDAMRLNTTASNNTAVGYQAAYSNTTGTGSTLMGYKAGYAGVTANGVSAFGYNALVASTGTGNSAFGAQVLLANTTGANNAAFGGNDFASYQPTLGNNTTGSSNSAFGLGALGSNTTASNNTAVGYQAGYSNTTGIRNTFLGDGAGYSNTTSSENTYVGRNAGRVATGANNAFFGEEAGVNATTGTFNAFIGTYSGSAVTTGSKNIILGSFSGNNGSLDIRTASNYIVLSDGDGNPRAFWNSNGFLKSSNGTVPSPASNYHQFINTTDIGGNTCAVAQFTSATVIGVTSELFACSYTNSAPNNTTHRAIVVNDNANNRMIVYSNGNIQNTNNSYGALSDIKIKENVSDATPKLEKLCQLRVVNYNLIGETQKQIGVIAQEVEQVFPSMVDETPDYENVTTTDEEGNEVTERIATGEVTKGVKYSVFVPMLIKAIQELKAEFDAYKATHP